MRFRKVAFVVITMLTIATSVWSLLYGATPRPVAVITSPKSGKNVKRVDEIVGRLQMQGTPLAYVREDDSGKPWQGQGQATISDKGNFKIPVRFGDASAAVGTKFSVVIIVARSADELDFYRKLNSLNEVPSESAKSEVFQVVLSPTDDRNASSTPSKPANATDETPKPGIINLTANNRVKRLTEVRGVVAKGAKPVILVRSLDDGEFWWVQQFPAYRPTGEFLGYCHFGNDRTPNDTKFEVAVIAVMDDEIAKSLQPGAPLVDIPEDVIRYKPVQVVLHR